MGLLFHSPQGSIWNTRLIHKLNEVRAHKLNESLARSPLTNMIQDYPGKKKPVNLAQHSSILRFGIWGILRCPMQSPQCNVRVLWSKVACLSVKCVWLLSDLQHRVSIHTLRKKDLEDYCLNWYNIDYLYLSTSIHPGNKSTAKGLSNLNTQPPQYDSAKTTINKRTSSAPFTGHDSHTVGLKGSWLKLKR